MLGIQYIKVPPTTYLMKYTGGKVMKEGAGLSCFYYAPMTTLVSIPVGTTDRAFIFEEVSADFQALTIQGQVTYRIAEPRKIASLLDYSISRRQRGELLYTSDDPEKLPQRVINLVQVLTRKALKTLPLQEAMTASEAISTQVGEALQIHSELTALGVQILGLSVLAIRPTPETAKALEAEAKEALLKQADEAIYSRRNAAVEQERAIKENELNTEIAVEHKKRQIRETQMDAEQAVLEKQHALDDSDLLSKIHLEEKRKQLVALAAENTRTQADANAYALAALLKSTTAVEPKILQAIVGSGMSPQQLISQAFQDLAGSAQKIGELNISPDLLGQLLKRQPDDGVDV